MPTARTSNAGLLTRIAKEVFRRTCRLWNWNRQFATRIDIAVDAARVALAVSPLGVSPGSLPNRLPAELTFN